MSVPSRSHGASSSFLSCHSKRANNAGKRLRTTMTAFLAAFVAAAAFVMTVEAGSMRPFVADGRETTDDVTTDSISVEELNNSNEQILLSATERDSLTQKRKRRRQQRTDYFDAFINEDDEDDNEEKRRRSNRDESQTAAAAAIPSPPYSFLPTSRRSASSDDNPVGDDGTVAMDIVRDPLFAFYLKQRMRAELAAADGPHVEEDVGKRAHESSRTTQRGDSLVKGDATTNVVAGLRSCFSPTDDESATSSHGGGGGGGGFEGLKRLASAECPSALSAATQGGMCKLHFECFDFNDVL